MNIEVIVATPEHAHQIAYIGRTAFRNAFADLFNNKCELEDYLDYTYHIDKIASSLRKENNQFFLAIADGTAVGFAKLIKHSLNEELDFLFQAELQKLYVLPAYHGRGVGNALMNMVVNAAELMEPDCLWLDTHVSNARAIKFYERHGFAKSGTAQFTIGSQTFDYYLMSMPVFVPLLH
jgi:ribosomal protein S18 acetylase RimI-like enzyme